MHIAVLNPSYGFLSGGYRKYLEQLIPLLQGDKRVTEMDVFVPEQSVEVLRLPEARLHAWAATDMTSGYPWLKEQLHRLSPDVVFIPSARWLDCGAIPVVTMVRNMEPLAAPFRGNAPLDRLKNIVRAHMIYRVCQRSNRVIAVSQYVRDFIVGKWRVKADKIGVVYHGITMPRGRNETIRPSTLPSDLAENSFFFTAGSLRPARGLEDLIQALALLGKQGATPTLVIGGSPHPGTEFYPAQMRKLAKRQGVATQIIWAGQLKASEMSWCFFNSLAFVTTSRAEACPNTVLEALSHGCLSVSTDQPPMPEFFQDAAFYYQGGKAACLATQLAQVLRASDDEKNQKKAAAFRCAHQFDWHATATSTITQLELALN